MGGDMEQGNEDEMGILMEGNQIIQQVAGVIENE